MTEENGQQRERRHFTAEFKVEAVRRVAERRATGVPMTQIARELDVRDDLLRKWQRQVGERVVAPPPDVARDRRRRPAEPARALAHAVARGAQQRELLALGE